MVCGIKDKLVNSFLKSVTDFYRLPVYSNIELLADMADLLDQLLNDTPSFNRLYEKNVLLPAVHHLPQAVASAGHKTRAVANSIDQLAPFLNWQQTSGYDVLGEQYCQNYGYCSIIGPNLLIEHSTLKLGFGIWGPGLHYPLHRHAAEECYHVLGSHILFRRQSQSWQRFSDGDAIYNEPHEIHELKSSDKPMFLLYSWRGSVEMEAQLIG